jgi:hypothetical protein
MGEMMEEKMSLELTGNYEEIINLIEQTKNRVNNYVNKELIDLYMGIGEYVSKKAIIEGWGKQTVKMLAKYLTNNYPNSKGFSAQNIWRMKQFYEIYKDDEKLSPLVRELNWTINLEIFSRTKSLRKENFILKWQLKKDIQNVNL